MNVFTHQTLRCPRCGGTLYQCRCRREAENQVLRTLKPVFPVLLPTASMTFVIPDAPAFPTAARRSAESHLRDPVPVRIPLP